ncbi:hypothetical protein D9M71_628010 [compost metagenome]
MDKGTDGLEVVACEVLLQLWRQVAQSLAIVAEDFTDHLRCVADQCGQCVRIEQERFLGGVCR